MRNGDEVMSNGVGIKEFNVITDVGKTIVLKDKNIFIE